MHIVNSIVLVEEVSNSMATTTMMHQSSFAEPVELGDIKLVIVKSF